MSESDITSQDHRTRHCPMLGHVIGLGYCRAPGVDLPCGRILDCWWEQFDVEAFIQAHYSPEQIQQVLAPRGPKVLTLMELIAKAQAVQRGGPA